MFDLTPHVVLKAQDRSRYMKARVALWVILAFSAVLAFLAVAFPDAEGFFDFRVYFGGRNTIAAPRFVDNGAPTEDGNIPKGKTMAFNFSARGQYSQVDVSLIPRLSGAKSLHGTVEVVRAYRALLYPEGDPVVFPDGSLIAFGGDTYLVSGGQARRFASMDILSRAGYAPGAAETVSQEEIATLSHGADIVRADDTPEGRIVFSDGNYYQRTGGKWTPFASERAYLSRFRREDAAAADDSIAKEATNDRMIGFLSGTILSYGEAVYVVEGDVLRPVDSPETYLIKGYSWDSVIPATGEEFGVYQRGKLYNFREPHPDGTVFSVPSENAYYVVDHGKRRPLRGENLIRRFSASIPVVGEVPSPVSCEATRTFFGDVRCTVDISRIRGTGAEYEFTVRLNDTASLSQMTTTFRRDVSQENWSAFLADLKARLIDRYGTR